MTRLAVVTGGSSGIGLAVCRGLVDQGWTVCELSRHESPDCPAFHLDCDVTDWAAIERAVEAVVQEHGCPSLLVTCAGFGISGAVEFTGPDAARRQFDVNFFGTAGAVRALLPRFRENGGGKIVCISSVAAPVAIPFQAYYSATKAAINDLVLALRGEVGPYNIGVCAVMPGDIRTGFTAAREKSPEGDEAYNGRISRSVAVMERDEQNGMAPEAVANVVLRCANKKRVKPLYSVGFKYRLFVVLARVLPSRLCSWIVNLLYAK